MAPDDPVWPDVVLDAVGAVLLDMDGTLVTSQHVTDRAWTAWARKRGKDAAVVMPYSLGRPTFAVMRAMAPELDDTAFREDLDEFHDYEVADVEGVLAADGAARLVAALRDAHVPHALVTSASRPVVTARMASSGLPTPDVVVSADDISRGKPDPQGFRLAAERLGVPPVRCVVVEDARSGVEAGHAAGCRVVAVGPNAACLGADAAALSLADVSLEVSGPRAALRINAAGST